MDRERNVMGLQERDKCFRNYADDQRELLFGKGHDYTAGKSEQDANHNFRVIAQLLEGAPITPYTIALVYKLKHTFSLITFAKTGKQSSGEPIRGRHLDESNYTFILSQLTEEHLAWLQQEAPQTTESGEKVISDVMSTMDLAKADGDKVPFDATKEAFERRLKAHDARMAQIGESIPVGSPANLLSMFSDHDLRNELQARQLRKDVEQKDMNDGESAGDGDHTDAEVAGVMKRRSFPKKRIKPVD